MKALVAVISALSLVRGAQGQAAQTAEAAPAPARHTSESPALRELRAVKRVYIEQLSGNDTAEAIRQLLIASLQRSQLFVLTDNPERADAVIRGAANDAVYVDSFDSRDSSNARSNGGAYTVGSTVSSRIGAYGGSSGSEDESRHLRERKHEAYLTVRLCNPEGDVLWATTQESHGAKFKGAGADVADKVARQLAIDLSKAAQTVRNKAAGQSQVSTR